MVVGLEKPAVVLVAAGQFLGGFMMVDLPNVHPVLLCGGSGTRLWPLSRQSYPKQFTRLIGNQSLFQASALRTLAEGFAAPVVVTGDSFRFIVLEQLAAVEMSPAAVLIEPDGRNTAPAVLVAALWLVQQDPDAVLLVSASDHVIPDDAAFRAAVMAAVPSALEGKLVTFGIQPTRPETGYGYLELGEGCSAEANEPQPLRRFVEKPNAERAALMLQSGNFLWNAGIFLFTARAVLDAFKVHAPELLEHGGAALAEATRDLSFTRLAPEPWSKLENISIDYAIMEKATNLVVMPYRAGWSDLGGWEAVWQETGPDEAGNVVSEHATAIACSGSLLRSEAPGVELVGIGLEDMIAVAMPDAVLVAKRADAQRVKDAVAALKARGAKQAGAFPTELRPWGSSERIAGGERFQVNHVVVKPGGVLALQSHLHRSEHWIVVQGTARVTIDDETRLAGESQSVYIPLGAPHRMENPGKVPLVLIEVQTGGYLDEDDIVRLEEVYGPATD